MYFKKKSSTLTRLLIIRFSAMGDVAMTVPVIHSLATQNSNIRITVLTRDRFTPMFEWMPANVNVIGVNLNNYDGISGLYKLYSELTKNNTFDAVADIHDVLRTKILRTFFRLSRTKVGVINKGRSDKHALIGHGQNMEALPLMTERYADVFRKLLELEFNIEYDGKRAIMGRSVIQSSLSNIYHFTGKKEKDDKWIGIAPFAAHQQKVYPLNKMRLAAELLLEKGYKVFLFGAGKEETAELHSWECDGMKSCCGKLNGLNEELLLMTQLDLMISMDSANMHMAAMLGTNTLTIWGATHPKAGFTAYGQGTSNVMQVDIPCRPCSIYGNKPCKYGDLRCMNGIRPVEIVERVTQILKK
ncbi:MAG: glycosyltransferase family 9 protein [Bacteroidaceae bacterium]|nr:glycosyltransferase family 9 protein [Bacteroidaceae bacterium]